MASYNGGSGWLPPKNNTRWRPHGDNCGGRRQSGKNNGNGVSAFRHELMLLRKIRDARDKATIHATAKRLKAALLVCASASAGGTDPAGLIDGQLLGMAAAQCSRLELPDLLMLLCSYAQGHMSRLGGREVAELAAAAMRLGVAEARFLRGTAGYFAALPAQGFNTLRDLALAATVMYQSWKSSTEGVDHSTVFRGLAGASLPHLRSKQVQPRDIAELVHAFAHALDVYSENGRTDNPVVDALRECFAQFQLNLTNASARDIAVVIGAAAAANTLPGSGGDQEDDASWQQLVSGTIRSCLQSAAAEACRRGCGAFNAHDLALMAHALSRAELGSQDFSLLLNDGLHAAAVQRLGQRELNFLIWAAAQLPGWSSQRFARVAIDEVKRRETSRMTPQDLCTLAQSLVRMSEADAQSLLMELFDEAFNRQLGKFHAKDCAALLWVIGKSPRKHHALCNLCLLALTADCGMLEREAGSTALWALTEVWLSLGADDACARSLGQALLLKQFWVDSLPQELANAAFVFSKLPNGTSLSCWRTFIQQVDKVDVSRLSLRDLCRILLALAEGMSSSRESSCGRVIEKAAAEASQRIDQGEVPTKQVLASLTEANNILQQQPGPLNGLMEQAMAATGGPPSDCGICGLAAPVLVPVRIVQSHFCLTPACMAMPVHNNMMARPPGTWASSAADKAEDQVASSECPPPATAAEATTVARADPVPEAADASASEQPPAAETSPSKAVEASSKDEQPVCIVTTTACPPGFASKVSDVGTPRSSPPELVEASTPSHYGHHHGGHYHYDGGHTHDCGHSHCSLETCSHAGSCHEQFQGHGHWHGHSHGAADDHHACCDAACGYSSETPEAGGAEASAAHGLCTDNTCCPAVVAAGTSGQVMRLNRHCQFKGHCVQMKNTFIHVACEDSESEGEHCFVCRFARSRSMDATGCRERAASAD
eukprot:TRINITY_DN91884_c0_g1_i1.p1 TRINITY_DN91884_c0_g1~~TRINITY_DN91884_c0_g1_i1.p1  ORF type:complete len:944 (+),score=156.64 TRINITY_DN91884_c0_g1_i1:158-2989(+)